MSQSLPLPLGYLVEPPSGQESAYAVAEGLVAAAIGTGSLLAHSVSEVLPVGRILDDQRWAYPSDGPVTLLTSAAADDGSDLTPYLKIWPTGWALVLPADPRLALSYPSLLSGYLQTLSVAYTAGWPSCEAAPQNLVTAVRQQAEAIGGRAPGALSLTLEYIRTTFGPLDPNYELLPSVRSLLKPYRRPVW